MLRRNLRSLLFVVGSLFFVFLIVTSWEETRELIRDLDRGLLALSVLVAIVDHVMVIKTFDTLLKKYSVTIPTVRVGQMYFLAQIAKYIPGRFWGVLFQATFVDQPAATTTMLLANIDLMALMIVRNSIVALGLLAILFRWHLAPVVLALGFAIFAMLARSSVVTRVLARPLRYWRVVLPAEDQSGEAGSWRQWGQVFAGTCVTYVAADYLLMEATFDFDWRQSTLYIAYFSLAWVAGMVSFIVPAGIGVREVVFVGLAQSTAQALSVEQLAAIAIVYRFWQILQEVVGLPIGLILKYLGDRSVAPVDPDSKLASDAGPHDGARLPGRD